MHPPNVFSEVVSKALADHLGYAIFAGTIKGRNQLYTTHEALKEDPAAFTIRQDIDQSLASEDDASTLMLSQWMRFADWRSGTRRRGGSGGRAGSASRDAGARAGDRCRRFTECARTATEFSAPVPGFDVPQRVP